jgi:hypothetical protein
MLKRMDSSSIELPGSEVESISLEGDTVRVRFSRAYIIKTMTGSTDRTRWWQAGELVLDEAEINGPLPQGSLVCDGGDIDENIYTYRDMIPIPLESRGRIRCELRFRDTASSLLMHARAVRLELEEQPKYIEHIRQEDR